MQPGQIKPSSLTVRTVRQYEEDAIDDELLLEESNSASELVLFEEKSLTVTESIKIGPQYAHCGKPTDDPYDSEDHLENARQGPFDQMDPSYRPMATINTIQEANSRLEDYSVDSPPLRMDFRDSLNRPSNVISNQSSFKVKQSLDR